MSEVRARVCNWWDPEWLVNAFTKQARVAHLFEVIGYGKVHEGGFSTFSPAIRPTFEPRVPQDEHDAVVTVGVSIVRKHVADLCLDHRFASMLLRHLRCITGERAEAIDAALKKPKDKLDSAVTEWHETTFRDVSPTVADMEAPEDDTMAALIQLVEDLLRGNDATSRLPLPVRVCAVEAALHSFHMRWLFLDFPSGYDDDAKQSDRDAALQYVAGVVQKRGCAYSDLFATGSVSAVQAIWFASPDDSHASSWFSVERSWRVKPTARFPTTLHAHMAAANGVRSNALDAYARIAVARDAGDIDFADRDRRAMQESVLVLSLVLLGKELLYDEFATDGPFNHLVEAARLKPCAQPKHMKQKCDTVGAFIDHKYAEFFMAAEEKLSTRKTTAQPKGCDNRRRITFTVRRQWLHLRNELRHKKAGWDTQMFVEFLCDYGLVLVTDGEYCEHQPALDAAVKSAFGRCALSDVHKCLQFCFPATHEVLLTELNRAL